MKRLLSLTTALLAAVPLFAQYPVDPVPFTSVKVEPQSFWGARLKASREVTIPLAFSKCEESGRYELFDRSAAQMASDTIIGYKVTGFPFDDTDVYKTIEGASYILQTYPDPRLEAYIDSVVAVMARAQEPDGYLYPARTMNPEHPHPWSGMSRWEQVEGGSHELYNLGHMVEGAVAHYQATGKRNFLDIAMRYADCVCREIGPAAGQLERVPGHQIAEMALARLYTVTGDRKYLDEAKFFLDRRGRTSHLDPYSQSHKPVVEQDEAVGHSVRAEYMYSGIADIAALTGDSEYIAAIDRIWENIVVKKLYITGGVGDVPAYEGFGEAYHLPNMDSYCETCAAIGNVYFNYRMFLLHAQSKYIDVLERSLYNGLISGVSMDGGTFFYPNPLESVGQHQRQAWFGCACCPSNICRFIPSLPGYIYAVKDNSLYVNLFASNTLTREIAGKSVTLTQKTEYPWDGDISVTIDRTALRKAFALKIRIPGWVRGEVVPGDLYSFADDVQQGYCIMVNGAPAEGELTSDGYYTIERKWRRGDCVRIHFDMKVRTVKANPAVKEDMGCVAVERGPLVYCAEWPDNQVSVHSVILDRKPEFSESVSEDLGGIVRISVPVQSIGRDSSGRVAVSDTTLNLIPYYAWCHRGPGEMLVWLPQELSAMNFIQ